MESQAVCILLYSKYSDKSQKLLNALKISPVDLTSKVGLTPVCIDNSNIRKKISNTTKLDIEYVPCILIVHNNGTVEKFEANDCINWIEETVRNLLPPQQPPPQPVYRQPPPPPVEPPSEEYQPPRKPKQKRKPVKQQTPPSSDDDEPQQSTKIEDLPEESESSDETQDIQKPPVAVRSGPGKYDISDDFSGQKNKKKNKVIENPREKKKGKGKENQSASALMAAAMAMQKDRENLEVRKTR